MAPRARHLRLASVAFAGAALLGQAAFAATEPRLVRVPPPKAYVDFCFRQPAECPSAVTATAVGAADPQQASAAAYWRMVFNASPPGDLNGPDTNQDKAHGRPPEDARLTTLSELNRQVNRRIAERSDMEVYGASDYWALPLEQGGASRGDCEDFALEKRHALRQAGYSEHQMAIALVKTPWGQNHAVLLVATPKGEVVLDNLSPHVEPWSRSSYTLIARQSFDDPAVWLGSRPTAGTGALAMGPGDLGSN